MLWDYTQDQGHCQPKRLARGWLLPTANDQYWSEEAEKKDGAGNVCQGEENGVSEAGTRARRGGAWQSQ